MIDVDTHDWAYNNVPAAFPPSPQVLFVGPARITEQDLFSRSFLDIIDVQSQLLVDGISVYPLWN
jgi:hypothetical protein